MPYRCAREVNGKGWSQYLIQDPPLLRADKTFNRYINIIYSAGASLGAPAGGYLADSPIGWRGSFLLQVPLCLAAFTAVGTALKLPPSGEHQTAWRAKIKRVDFLGAVTLVAAVFCLLFALDHGSNVAWDEKLTLIPLGVSFVLGAAFLYVEMKVAAEPFAPGRIIFARSLLCAHLCNFFSCKCFGFTLSLWSDLAHTTSIDKADGLSRRPSRHIFLHSSLLSSRLWHVGNLCRYIPHPS